MPQNTNRKRSQSSQSTRAPQAKRTVGKAKSTPQAQKRGPQNKKKKQEITLWSQISPFVLIVCGIIIAVCLVIGKAENASPVTGAIYSFLAGLFSISAFLIPVFLIFSGVSGLINEKDSVSSKRTAFATVSALLFAVLLELISPCAQCDIAKLYAAGGQLSGGGVLGGLIGQGLLFCFGSIISYIIVIAFLLLCVLLSVGITPKYLALYISQKLREMKESIMEDEEEEYEEAGASEEPVEDSSFAEPEVIPPEAPIVKAEKKPKQRKPKFDTDIPLDDDYPEETETKEEKARRVEDEKYNEILASSRKNKSAEELRAEKEFFGEAPESDRIAEESVEPISDEEALLDTGAELIDRLADSFLGENNKAPEKMSVEREILSNGAASAKQIAIDIPKPEYKYPPLDLLSEGTGAKRTENVREELHSNAAKLVQVLASFNVKTKIVGVSRGPTITRYELLPEPGTRVKSIANLVDDIALNLATSGVRIEAPIPGKAAVGIEVPNKSAETVYLRTLLSDKAFTEHKSRVCSGLGKDVAGSTVIMDIMKMPHLLIAGATGMGKSVCINCLLVSLLYKSSPEEVKLILIDPKKVEFSIYNGLPHLLVPVVSDPKKAAGSLSWAVNEMERRFGLIESVGVRDIDGFNKITENDPEYEHLPRIVIVIDELADLMSTAPDDVETSIARLAAKARAAGMHLVIGTQRPSVDVITGVIKANIPSRIACTVASQTDSRTIIDRSGAENLIGRGDMLYNPVGAAKPMRVQGAFVSDSEVDSVVSFIKANNSANGAEYSDEVMKQIEAQAAMCGTKKGTAPVAAQEGGDSGDPLINQALDVAFESGKISTSLLQRRLSIGYGRAAKIIDKMEELGYVSAPDGQKPRELLITKQDYMEMALKKEDTE
ncbi:MAG: DNA translocase FtsK [Ruminococcaceae bacterium]|nr:DNA translocase FtsK [Oscillospiraceae bacterium]